ncbi:hypothetical protein [Paenibacillus aceti]|uniref:Uncharacterized protein n=1 Tax=Paenibacillus aceti TaxID=1820010 RepID=A0ABQ1W2R4_9BACL|nr:hypothetical protein [Paenibacillus aceti]GGG08576.1 hypothetical protein GCM10010913_32930 [Paenibacillus aceti]
MVSFEMEGCYAYVVKGDLVVIIDIEEEAAILTRLNEKGKVDECRFLHFETRLTLKLLHEIHTARNELDLVMAVLEG